MRKKNIIKDREKKKERGKKREKSKERMKWRKKKIISERSGRETEKSQEREY